MKKKMCLMGLGACSLGICGNAERFAYADPPEVKKAQVVVVGAADEKGFKDIISQVEKELEKANISAELKADILKKVEAAVNKAGTMKAGQAKILSRAQTVTQDMKPGEGNEEVTVQILNRGDDNPTVKNLNIANVFRTQIARAAKASESYRIGIAFHAVAEDGADEKETHNGLRVESVVDGSPAEKAGIQEGDILVTVDGSTIEKVPAMIEMVQEAGKSDKALTLELKRDDKTVKIEVKPTKMASSDVEMNNIELTLPSSGFVFDSNGAIQLQDILKHMPQQMANGVTSMTLPRLLGNSDELKKELAELKAEISELKKMVKELVDKK